MLEYFKIDNLGFLDVMNEILTYIFEPLFKTKNVDSFSESKFSYTYDFDLLYANFKKSYGIDLIRDNISWLEFQFILNSLLLEDDNSLVKRIQHRTLPNTQGMSKEQKQYYGTMYSTYTLTQFLTEEEYWDYIYKKQQNELDSLVVQLTDKRGL